MYKISAMQEQEIKDVIKFHNKYLGNRTFINEKEITNRLKNNTGIFLTAKENNKIIGIKLGYINGRICIGRGIAIDKKHRRLGIGKSLVEEFEKQLNKYPNIEKYIFASSTLEGVPFHINLGYKPTILLQSFHEILLEEIDLKEFSTVDRVYNQDNNLYQVYIKPKRKLDMEYLSKLKSKYPQFDIQYLFEKDL